MKFRGIKFLTSVIIIYTIVAVFNYDKFVFALGNSEKILIRIIPILLVVVLITAIINYFVSPKKLIKYFSNKKMGYLIALIAGVVSHGPMYGWYPLIENLKKRGLNYGYIATFFYARAIKVPLLPIMLNYFGWKFTFFISLYTLIAALMEGLIIDKIFKN
ncbi:permease [Lebetimonas sp. JH292]|uniref:permease n=1 Tax=Lebetimonas sp. JH292 TaxID=990068 RepID=UPI0004636A0C|nr:permease [Lebetimonas sp. JH292]